MNETDLTGADAVRERVLKLATQCLVDERIKITLPIRDPSAVKLLGDSAITDSIGLVSYLVALEEATNQTFSVSVAMMDERAMAQSRSPFRNLATVVEFVTTMVLESKKS